MKRVLVLVFSGAIFFFTLVVIFRVDSSLDFIPADSGAMVNIPNAVATGRKILTSDLVLSFAKKGIGGRDIAGLATAMENLRKSPFTFEFIKFLDPKITIVVPDDVFYGKDRLPFVMILDLGRAMSLVDLFNLNVTGTQGRTVYQYYGRPIMSDGKIGLTVIRNLLLFGGQEAVEKSVATYEGGTPSIRKKPEMYKAGLKLLEKDADFQGIVLSPAILSPKVGRKGFDPRALFAAQDVAGGAFNLRIGVDGLRGNFVFQALPGKTLVTGLDTGVASKPFALARFMNDGQLFASGIRSSRLGDFSGAVTQQILSKSGEESNFKTKLTAMLVGELLGALGPEAMVFIGPSLDIGAVAQVKDETLFAKNLSARQKAQQKENLTRLAGALVSKETVESVLKEMKITQEQIGGLIDELPSGQKKKIKKIVDDFLAQSPAQALPRYPSLDFMKHHYFYHVQNGLLFLSPSEPGIDGLMSLPAETPLSRGRTFLDGGPLGSAFFTMNLTSMIQDVIPRIKESDDLLKLFEKPWLAAAQIKDEGSSVRIEGGLDADFGLSVLEPEGLTFYGILFHAVRLLLAAFGLFMGYIFISRIVRTIKDKRKPTPRIRRK